MIITTGGLKGGGGKSTAATNLAIMRMKAGRKVLLVDADEQRSASEFVEQREALGHGTLPCVQLVGQNVVAQLRALAPNYDDVIVDTGGRDTQSQRSALLASDILLLPFQPGNYDLWTVAQVERLIGDIKSVNEKLRALAYISRGYPVGSDNGDAAAMLRKSDVITFLDVTIIGRKAFNMSAGEGLAVVEMPKADKKAVAEIEQLYRAVFGPVAAKAVA
jgi:chromosome partitioning protein